jgi:hypothetical protein
MLVQSLTFAPMEQELWAYPSVVVTPHPQSLACSVPITTTDGAARDSFIVGYVQKKKTQSPPTCVSW